MFRIAYLIFSLAAGWPETGYACASRYVESVLGAVIFCYPLVVSMMTSVFQLMMFAFQLMLEGTELVTHFLCVPTAYVFHYVVYPVLIPAFHLVTAVPITLATPFVWYIRVLRGSEGDMPLWKVFFERGRFTIAWTTRNVDWEDEYCLKRSNAGTFMPQTLGLRRLEGYDRRGLVFSAYRTEPVGRRYGPSKDSVHPGETACHIYNGCWRVMFYPYEFVLAKARKPPDLEDIELMLSTASIALTVLAFLFYVVRAYSRIVAARLGWLTVPSDTEANDKVKKKPVRIVLATIPVLASVDGFSATFTFDSDGYYGRMR